MDTLTEGGALDATRAERLEPHVFLVMPGSSPAHGGARQALAHLHEVVFARSDRPGSRRGYEGSRRRLVVEVPDGRMSATHARLHREDGGFVLEDAGSRNGTRLNGAPIARAALRDGDFFELGRSLFRYRAGLLTSALSPADVSWEDLRSAPAGLRTLLPEHAERLAVLGRIAARATAPVLFLGETGSGKEVLARAVHELSGRRGKFVPVNCGALPGTLVEGLLFGHTKGAFTGAAREEPGFVRAADGGTLFLDEIGDLPLPSQAALLRVLQEREVTPVGSTATVQVDVRVVAATHRPLEALVSSGAFRADLYSRLAGFVHRLPPLRERIEDLGGLAATLLGRLPAPIVSFTPEASRALAAYAWPHNVRELEQCLGVACVLAKAQVVDLAELPEALARPPRSPAPEVSGDELEAALRGELTRARGNVSEVARSMGKARMQIQRWMKRFQLSPSDFKD